MQKTGELTKGCSAGVVAMISTALAVGGVILIITTGNYTTDDKGDLILEIRFLQGAIGLGLIAAAAILPAWAGRRLGTSGTGPADGHGQSPDNRA